MQHIFYILDFFAGMCLFFFGQWILQKFPPRRPVIRLRYKDQKIIPVSELPQDLLTEFYHNVGQLDHNISWNGMACITGEQWEYFLKNRNR